MSPVFAHLRIISGHARWPRKLKKQLKKDYVLLVTKMAVVTAEQQGRPERVPGLVRYGKKLLKRIKFSVGSES